MLLLLTLIAPPKVAKKSANLNDVNQEISFAINPCSTAPGNKSGIVHAHSHFIIKNANIIIPITNAKIPGTIFNNFFDNFT